MRSSVQFCTAAVFNCLHSGQGACTLLIVLKRPQMFQSACCVFTRPQSLLGALEFELSKSPAFDNFQVSC